MIFANDTIKTMGADVIDGNNSNMQDVLEMFSHKQIQKKKQSINAVEKVLSGLLKDLVGIPIDDK